MQVPRILLVLSSLLMPTIVSSQTLGNDGVLSLTQAGLGDGVVIAKINSQPCSYDVSTDKLILLKKNGVSDGIITAMVTRCSGAARAQGIDNSSSDPLIKHRPGIYLLQDWTSPASLAFVRPSTGGGTRTSGNGSIAFPLKSLLVVPGPESQNIAKSNHPTFYFYFDASDKDVSDFGVENSKAAQSPSEFALVKLRLKNNSREFEVGRFSAYFTVSLHKGINAKDTIEFSTKEVGDGIFKVASNSDLAPGEYAYVFSTESGRSRIYDFSIAAPVVPETKSNRP